ncbi:hypothetical protein MBT84_45430 [Streptomyces sp. MBT84]|nr:hypothetical protein [Streptomyces sp. MBT84]
MAETAIPEMVRQRGEEEGIGDGPTARARTTRMYLKPVAATPGLQIGCMTRSSTTRSIGSTMTCR